MLPNMKNSKYKSSIAKGFEASVESSRRLSRELTLELQEMTQNGPSFPIQSAQRLLARIAARITTERKRDEQRRNNETDPFIDYD